MSYVDRGKRAAGALSTALHRLAGSRGNRLPGILLYHRIAPEPKGVPAPTWNVTPERFREQLTGLLQLGFAPWPLSRMLAARKNGDMPTPRTFVVTFDDAFASVHQHAWPVLRDLGIPATAFLATAYLDSSEPFPFDPWGIAHRKSVSTETFLPLSRQQCREMASAGALELGAHTHRHLDRYGSPAEFQSDLQRSVEEVRELTRQDAVPFAFPYGRRYLGFVSDELIEAARRTGVTCALTTESEPFDPAGDPFRWGRFNAYDFDDAASLAAKLAGWYGWAPKLQERLSARRRAGERRTQPANEAAAHEASVLA